MHPVLMTVFNINLYIRLFISKYPAHSRYDIVGISQIISETLTLNKCELLEGD